MQSGFSMAGLPIKIGTIKLFLLKNCLLISMSVANKNKFL